METDSLNPYTKKIGWSASGILHTGNDADQVTLQANFSVAVDYTVEFGLFGAPINPSVPIRAEALISWKVEGNTVTRRVNVGNGVSVTGVGQACRVVIVDVTDRALVGLGESYIVSVQVAPGTRGNTQEPPTLQPFPKASNALIVVPPVGLTSVPIPQDAGIVSVSITAFPDAPGLVIAAHDQGLTVLKLYVPKDYIWVPVAPGATAIRLINGSAVPVSYSVTFGIDG